MRRLYSTFAQGLPGIGLVLIRLAVAITACVHAVGVLLSDHSIVCVLVAALHVSLAALLVVGLWTPVAGTLLALLAIADAYVHAELRWYFVLVGTVAAAVALVGPGCWSIDARLYGWKRLEISNRKRPDPPA